MEIAARTTSSAPDRNENIGLPAQPDDNLEQLQFSKSVVVEAVTKSVEAIAVDDDAALAKEDCYDTSPLAETNVSERAVPDITTPSFDDPSASLLTNDKTTSERVVPDCMASSPSDERYSSSSITKDVSESVALDDMPYSLSDERYSGVSLTKDIPKHKVVGGLLDKEEDLVVTCSNFKTVLETPPSKFKSTSEVKWIYLFSIHDSDSDSSDDEDYDVPGLLKEWKWYLENDTPVTFALVRDLATKYQVLIGKWMIFCKHGPHIDLTWKRIARSHNQGKLGISTKVSTADEDHSHHVICVYNRNFTDKKDVYELESKLRKAGIRCSMKYKPDVFTHCVIYRANKWKMKPFIYTSLYDVKTKKSVIIKEYDDHYGDDDDDDGVDNDHVGCGGGHGSGAIGGGNHTSGSGSVGDDGCYHASSDGDCGGGSGGEDGSYDLDLWGNDAIGDDDQAWLELVTMGSND